MVNKVKKTAEKEYKGSYEPKIASEILIATCNKLQDACYHSCNRILFTHQAMTFDVSSQTAKKHRHLSQRKTYDLFATKLTFT
jgi:hypothetical protein